MLNQRTMRLGRGVNIAPFSVRYEQLDAADLAGLKARGVDHVRIGGWIAAALQNWTTCPASTLRMPSNERAAINHILGGEAFAPDPARRRPFWRLWLAAKAAVDAGLHVVLNPFHQRMLVDVSHETVRWVWAAVLQEFLVEDFPVDSVVFEMVNEPANWTHANVVGNWTSIVHDWVAQVRRVQPDRMLLLTGVQGMRGGTPPSVSSLEGLVLDLQSKGTSLMPSACDGKCMVTFHYYEPRWFTSHQGDNPSWVDTPSALAEMNKHFDSVVRATPPGVGIYLGEFGLIPDRVNMSQGVRWLEAVRRTADRYGLVGYSVWTYYGTHNGIVAEAEGSTASERLCAWDRSPFVPAALGLPHRKVNASEPSCMLSAAVQNNISLHLPSSNRTCPADGDRRPEWADALIAPPPAPRQVAAIVNAAMVIDVVAVIFLVIAAIYFMSLRWCWSSVVIDRDGTRRNRLVAGRQTMEFCADAPPPSASPIQQDGLPAAPASPDDPPEAKPPRSAAIVQAIADLPGAPFRWRSSLVQRWETVQR